MMLAALGAHARGTRDLANTASTRCAWRPMRRRARGCTRDGRSRSAVAMCAR